MRKIIFTLLSLGFFMVAQAQKALPEIKVGTVLNCNAYVSGQEFPLVLTVKSIAGPVSMGWSVDGYGDGSFEMTAKALESGTDFFVTTQPALGATKLTDAETFGLISKAAYKTLIDTKTFTYGGKKFKVKTTDAKPMKWGSKELDATHVASEDGKTEIWILNNPNFPLMVQTVGFGTDIIVNEIK